MIVILLGLATFAATMLGGLAAFRLKDRLHLILGFSAGAVVGVAFFDLLPEAIKLSGGRPLHAMLFVAAGFLFYLLLDRVALLHAHDEDDAHRHGHGHETPRGPMGAITLVAHSVFDGIAIGLAFRLSEAIGLAVALAVVTHDFSDGINTASVVLKSGGSRGDARRWLLADALAPTAGLVLTLFLRPAGEVFATLLAVFAGLFLYLGASDLVPESHHAHPKFLTTAMTVAGALLIYVATVLGGV